MLGALVSLALAGLRDLLFAFMAARCEGGRKAFLVMRKAQGSKGWSCEGEGMMRSQMMAWEGGEEGVREG